MSVFRKYGKVPFRTVVVHGGPGAAGEMAPVARELAKTMGVLEPLQSAHSIAGQVAELKSVMAAEATAPVVLIGYSWGAWLSFIFSAQYPAFVHKLILVSSGPFCQSYAPLILKTRLSRLSAAEREEVQGILTMLSQSAPEAAGRSAFARLGELFHATDSYRPCCGTGEPVSLDASIFASVWPEADSLRRSGALLDYGKKITCPVVAIQGQYDPHPSKGVRVPLSRVLRDFRFVELKECGHTPWLESRAAGDFYRIVKKESCFSRRKTNKGGR